MRRLPPEGRAETRPSHDLLGVILILTERCNSRCLMCDYWRARSPRSLGRVEIARFWDEHMATRPRFVTLSGGEPLLHPELFDIAACLRSRTDNLVLSTNGVLLGGQLARVADHFEKVIVSLDGASRDTVRSIRGVDVFHSLIRSVAGLGKRRDVRVVVKMTIQAGNFRETGDVIKLAADLGAAGVGFTVPDLESGAFAREPDGASTDRDRIMLSAGEAEEFARVVEELLAAERDLFERGFVVEGNLEDFVAYFRFRCGTGPALPRRRCDVAFSRLVVSADGAIRPCFFLDPLCSLEETPPGDFFRSEVAAAFRAGFDATADARCRRCHQFRDWSF